MIIGGQVFLDQLVLSVVIEDAFSCKKEKADSAQHNMEAHVLGEGPETGLLSSGFICLYCKGRRLSLCSE